MYGEEEDKFSLCESNYYLPTSGFILLLLLHNHLQTAAEDRKSTRLNSSHRCISYAVFCLKKKKKKQKTNKTKNGNVRE